MRYLPAVIVDALLVLVFAAIGRASHDESPAGFLLTAWPFLVALLVGHLLAALLPARPRRPWSLLWGVVVWVVTVVGGMLLRVVSGDTAQVPFIIVATLTLGVFLVGWRGITALVRRNRSRAAAGDPALADDARVDAAPEDVAPAAVAPRDVAPEETAADAATGDDAPTRRDDGPVA